MYACTQVIVKRNVNIVHSAALTEASVISEIIEHLSQVSAAA